MDQFSFQVHDQSGTLCISMYIPAPSGRSLSCRTRAIDADIGRIRLGAATTYTQLLNILTYFFNAINFQCNIWQIHFEPYLK